MLALCVCLLLAVSGCTPGSSTLRRSPSGPVVATRERRWAEDIAYLVERMESLHPDLFHGVSRETFGAAVDGLVARLPELDDDEVLVGVMRLVAMISSNGRDGHMGVWPPDNTQAIHRFPLRVWEFPEGLFVTAARAPNEDLVGSRIVAVDGVPIAEVLDRLDPVVPRDNASNLRAARTVFLTSAEVLAGLGIAHDRLTMELEVEAPDGSRRVVAVEAVDGETFADWVGGWELPLPERPGLAFLRDLDEEFTIGAPAPGALVVRYDHVEESSAELVEAIRAAMRERPVDRLVLDLRSNGGGEAGGYRDLLRFLASGPVDRLVVLVGRLTFSAAVSLVVLLERRAPNVLLVGEDTGGAPSFWADPATVTLPNSGLRALVSERHFGDRGDPRTTVEPGVRVPFTSSDYFGGHDPVLEAALAGAASDD